MAPKKAKEQVKKRKTGSSSTTRRTSFDPNRFRGPKQFARFQELEQRTICPERIFEISDVGNFSRFADIINGHNWAAAAAAGGDDVARDAGGDDVHGDVDDSLDQQAADAFMDEDDDGEDDDAASDEEAVDEDSISDDF
ncbi:hypothetical protein P8452_47189 [Trifolium repens]|nr:hypothetical protein P8452_47189 [Trifolium repens]